MKCPKFHTSFFGYLSASSGYLKLTFSFWNFHALSKYPHSRSWPLECACSLGRTNLRTGSTDSLKRTGSNERFGRRCRTVSFQAERERGGGQAALIYRHNYRCITDRPAATEHGCAIVASCFCHIMCSPSSVTTNAI